MKFETLLAGSSMSLGSTVLTAFDQLRDSRRHHHQRPDDVHVPRRRCQRRAAASQTDDRRRSSSMRSLTVTGPSPSALVNISRVLSVIQQYGFTYILQVFTSPQLFGIDVKTFFFFLLLPDVISLSVPLLRHVRTE